MHNQEKQLLGFWQGHWKVWVTTVLFMDWFSQCCLSEVKRKISGQEELQLQFLLVTYKATVIHVVSVCCQNENAEVLFSPPNSTSLLQPLGQDIICFVKTTCICLVFDCIWSAINAATDADQMHHLNCTPCNAGNHSLCLMQWSSWNLHWIN